ncbi:serine/threonine-protein kinase [Thalassoroseus pseudoceratinae]|uniref:serine/threonine-protein kinase n=1 Tax=Thalassoroseus pseudoceratinae TaxID=2713176 RepID=UPI001423D40A|nr:serine/threonine-protein kinase [Thalassoroseus pseudoceratinae]
MLLDSHQSVLVPCPSCQNGVDFGTSAAASTTCGNCGHTFVNSVEKSAGCTGQETVAVSLSNGAGLLDSKTAAADDPIIDPAATKHSSGSETTRLGHFVLEKLLGEGGFGCVYQARDLKLDRAVAIKLPRSGQLTEKETSQFLKEARAAAQLRHPNIVGVHEVGMSDGSVYIATDFINGQPMDDWLESYQPTHQESAELCRTLAEALHHAHQRGVIHRDLKPANILLDEDGQPHIADFGLAKREFGETSMTAAGVVMGTPAYMAPEQATGQSHEADARADIYALGTMLFEMLTGERPFRGSTQALLYQVVNAEPPLPRTIDETIPEGLEAICICCLAKDPDHRFASAQDLADALTEYLEERQTSVSLPTALTETKPNAWIQFWNRHPFAVAVGVGISVMLAAGGIAVAYKSDAVPPSRTVITSTPQSTVTPSQSLLPQVRQQLREQSPANVELDPELEAALQTVEQQHAEIGSQTAPELGAVGSLIMGEMTGDPDGNSLRDQRILLQRLKGRLGNLNQSLK